MNTTQNDLDREQVEIAQRTSRSRKAVKQELHQLMEDVEELVRRVGAATDPELQLLRNKVQLAVASARQAVEDRTEWPRQRAREALSASDAYVHEQPWQAIGVAGLLGIAVGFLMARR